MKVKRTVGVEAKAFAVGDIINIKLTNGVKAQAMAMKREENGMIFCFVDCLPGSRKMNGRATNMGGYECSDLCKELNSEILRLFPTELKSMMIPFENGDLLRLPTEKEIFGTNVYGECENFDVEQWKPMKKRRNRMAFDGSRAENFQCYWLANERRNSSTDFAYVARGGYAYSSYASHSCGVRSAFILNLVSAPPRGVQ